MREQKIRKFKTYKSRDTDLTETEDEDSGSATIVEYEILSRVLVEKTL